MSYEDHSEDVAADFRDALEGLTMNSRVEITTLTVIARENTEYAHGISEVLQEHIKKACFLSVGAQPVAPAKKLPALYLLDSIVKNVGTPYTIYFSRGLYSTFMNAYASVDNATRRKMDEMLKTWKEPVPGSVDPRPVFSIETVRPIENALIKARASAFQAQQEHMRTEQQLLGGRNRPHSATPYRETSTPPGGRPGYPPPPGQLPPGQQPQQQGYPLQQQPPTTQTTPQPPIYPTAGGPFQPPPQQQQQPAPGPYAPRISVDSLNEDVDRLIRATQAELAQKPYDASVAGRLKALMDLQTILKIQNLDYDKLVLVRAQIDALTVNLPGHLKASGGSFTPTPPAPAYAPYQPPPQQQLPQQALSQAPQPTAGPGVNQPLSAAVLAAFAAARGLAAGPAPAQAAAPTPAPPLPQQPTGAPTLSLDSLLGRGALAAIMAARKQQQPTPPQQQQQQPSAYGPPTPQLQQQPLAMQAPPARPPGPPGPFPAGLPANIQALLSQAAAAAGAPPATAPAAAPAALSSTANPLALVDMLRRAGIIQPTAPSGVATVNTPLTVPAQPPALTTPGLANIIASIRSPAFGVREPLREIQNEISFQAASLKKFRPHLLPLLYEDLGPPCTQCGRRFRTDDAGRAAKTAHMDWHFRVHQRIVEAEKRGQHRSWYVDQADWIHSREDVDPDGTDRTDAHGSNGSGRFDGNGSASGSGGGSGSKLQWIPVPTGSASTNQACPICQEKFEMKWLEEAQEWVWIDAVRIGNRVYHASCHAEATQSGNARDRPAATAMAASLTGPSSGGAQGATRGNGMPIPTGPAADRARHQHGTDAVLGKRKADDGHGGSRRNNQAAAHGGKNAPAGRKRKRGAAGGGGAPWRPPDLDRVDPDIGGGGASSGDGAGGGGAGGAGGGGGRFHGRNGGKHRGGGGGGAHDNGSSEDAKVDLNALPY